MFAGHLGAGLLLKRAGPRVGLGSLFLGAMLLDAVLWSLVLAGVESVHAPPNLRTMADLTFDFPYSHSLVASLAWAAAAFLLGWRAGRRTRQAGALCAFVLAASVFSHFALDWLVHVPELPVAGRNSARLGLGLWRQLPWAWSVEAVLLGGGLWVYLTTQRLPRGRAFAIIAVMGLVLAMTIIGQASGSNPAPPALMAATSLVTIGLLVTFGWWVERGVELP